MAAPWLPRTHRPRSTPSIPIRAQLGPSRRRGRRLRGNRSTARSCRPASKPSCSASLSPGSRSAGSCCSPASEPARSAKSTPPTTNSSTAKWRSRFCGATAPVATTWPGPGFCARPRLWPSCRTPTWCRSTRPAPTRARCTWPWSSSAAPPCGSGSPARTTCPSGSGGAPSWTSSSPPPKGWRPLTPPV